MSEIKAAFQAPITRESVRNLASFLGREVRFIGPDGTPGTVR